MKLNESHIKQLKEAAERIGEFGKITLNVSGGVVDIITEDRKRIQNGYKDTAEIAVQSANNIKRGQPRNNAPENSTEIALGVS